ncbi:MAG: endolytic transglycosylase MltG [Prevotellaceae bacterium]|jgi:UPF0755 protein|nr:endolytic transglycosylase MltG [Prevotellaceae bacterium]
MKRSTKIWLAAGTTVVILAAALAIAGYKVLLAPQFTPASTVYVQIDRDDTVDSVYYKVQTIGQAKSMLGFRWMAVWKEYDRLIRTGNYAIRPDDTPYRLYQRLAGGMQTPVKLTIGSVRTMDRLARLVGAQLMIDSAEVAKKLYDTTFVTSMQYTLATLPCLFIPNTYEVYWNIPVDDFFRRMQREHDAFWNKERTALADSLGLTPTQVGILASVVDEETNDAAEKPIVAGLYLNRLKRGMLLQADPTVKFAVGDFGLRRILNRHLAIDSPYNTYKYSGLPPGPIRIPSIEGIEAVLHARRHNYLYMAAKEDFSGRHNFASTLSEHLRNARKYQAELNKRKIFD